MNGDDRKQGKLSTELSDPVKIPEQGIERAVQILRSGRLFRYGEFKGGASEVAMLEREFADYMGRRYAVAMNSCGSTLFIALKCAGVQAGDSVLVNAFTLAPVPGAIEHAAAKAVFAQCTTDCIVDLSDLERLAQQGAKIFLMSHMRGHIADMDAVQSICRKYDITLIEDCAHTLGAKWDGKLSGSFGSISCFSLQAFKHINAGEGGILVTDDEDVAARAILYSGSYMLYGQNGAAPAASVFERHKYSTPNFSLRMQEITAAVARPQIPLLAARTKKWRESYDLLARLLSGIPQIRLPVRDARENFVASSIQFFLQELNASAITAVLDICSRQGVDIKWFGREVPMGFTATWQHWRFTGAEQSLPETREVLSALCDMRIPLSLSTADCEFIAATLEDAIRQSLP